MDNKTILNAMPNGFLPSYEKLISKKEYPSFYYEWTVLNALRDKQCMLSDIFDESYQYPHLNNVLLAIKDLVELPFEKLYPDVLQNWINDASRLCLEVYRCNNEENINNLVKHLGDGGYHNDDVPKYYKLCIRGFSKIHNICSRYPAGSPIIKEATNLGAYLSEVCDMSISKYLQNLLDLEVDNISDKAIKILHLANKNEHKDLEFKSSFIYDVKKRFKNKALKKECTKTIAGFLNSSGGTLLVGVEDDGNIIGLAQDLSYTKNDDEFTRNFKEAVKNALSVSVFNNVEWSLEDVGKGLKVLIVEVTPAPFPCFHDKTEFFIRNNASSDQISSDEKRAEYITSRFNVTTK